MLEKETIVFDTNTLISAVLRFNSVPGLAFQKASAEFQIVYSKEILEEMIDVFRREKFDKYISLKERLDFLDSFIRSAILIEAPKLPKPVCRDPKDDKYLALAIAAQSKIIVTGDTDLLVLNPYKGITIINSFDFLHQYVEYSKK